MLDQGLPVPMVSVFEESKPAWLMLPAVAHYEQGPTAGDPNAAVWDKFRGA
jgi:hypothetical protein